MNLAKFGVIPFKPDWSCPICEYINIGREEICLHCKKGKRPIKRR